MRATSAILLLLLSAALTGAQGPPRETETQQRPPQGQTGPTQAVNSAARLSGRVLRAENNQPLAKASLTLFPDGRPGEVLTTRTDSAGTFEFKDVQPGRYRLRAERTGYVGEVYGQRGGGPGIALTLESGRHLERIEFRLQRAGVISGTVTDEDQEPVEGLIVRAERIRFAPGGRQQVTSSRSARTDDLGNYRLANLAPGTYYVKAGGREGVGIGQVAAVTYTAAYHPGVAARNEASRVQVTAAGETRRVDVQVRSGAAFTISGVVVDGTPAAARKNYSIGFASGEGMAMRSLDRPDGSFTLRGIEPGDYTLVATVSADGAPQRRGYRAVRVADSDVSVAVEIGRSAEVRGKAEVQGGGEFSFAGLRIRLRPEAEGAVTGLGSIEEDGTFKVADVPEGNYILELAGRDDEVYLKEARCEGEDHVTRPLLLSPDQVVERCTVVLARDVTTAAGVVLREERPVAGAVVVLIPAEPERRRIPRHTASTQTDENGQFTLRGVIPGEYAAFAVMPAEDAAYYDLEFPNRNRDKAEKGNAKAGEPLVLNLKLLAQPR
jgi:protocatechuate 3,4-dioxygenase beta subunit